MRGGGGGAAYRTFIKQVDDALGLGVVRQQLGIAHAELRGVFEELLLRAAAKQE